MIKLTLRSVCFSTIVFFSAPAFADSYYHFETCKEKNTQIEQQISYAKHYNNQYKVDKLEKKLNDISINCKDEDLQKEYQNKVDKKQEKVTERLKELQEAQQKGNMGKITEKKTKLQKAQTELKSTQEALESFKSRI